jgi:hypothetical protein
MLPLYLLIAPHEGGGVGRTTMYCPIRTESRGRYGAEREVLGSPDDPQQSGGTQ